MVSAWVPNKYDELREHRCGRPARFAAGVVPTVVHLDFPPVGRGPGSQTKKTPRDDSQRPGYVEWSPSGPVPARRASRSASIARTSSAAVTRMLKRTGCAGSSGPLGNAQGYDNWRNG